MYVCMYVCLYVDHLAWPLVDGALLVVSEKRGTAPDS
jgi:hypothetical protein